MRSGGLAVVVVAVVAAALLNGCGSDGPSSEPSPSRAPGSTSPAASPTPTGPAGVLAGCPVAGAEHFVADLPDDNPVTAESPGIDGTTVGTGDRAVVISYEWGSSACAWAPVAAELAEKGYQVALWRYGQLTGLDRIHELQAVVDHVRDNGATKVVLAGGSVGGCVSMIGASTVVPAVSGVAVFSCASWYDVAHRLPTTPLAAKVKVPALYLAGADDRVPVAEIRKDFAAVPSKDKKLVVVPASAGHGVDLLTDPKDAAVAKPAFLEFLDRVTS